MRKRPTFVGTALAAVLFFVGAMSLVRAQEPTRKVLYSLAPGETILQVESTFGLMANAADIVLVTATGDKGPFFVVRDGKRRGPFATLKEAMAAAYEGGVQPEQKRNECAAYAPEPGSGDTQAEAVEAGAQAVRFKGKTLGPYLLIFTTRLTPDSATVFLTAADKDKAWFECSDGRKVSFGGVPGELRFSPNGRNAAVLVQGRMSMADMENLSKLSQDKLMAALKEQDRKYLYTIDGKKFGPFDSFESSSFWYPKTSDDLYFRVEGQVFRNGVPMMKIESLDSCNFYPSPDGKTYALFDYSNITFSDGKTYPSPLDIRVIQDKGKTIFRWITLENNRDLIVYERAT